MNGTKFNFKLKFPKEIVIRAIADTLIINSSLILAYIFYFLIRVWFQLEASYLYLRILIEDYFKISWLLTIISLSIFYISGFYTHGRAYRSRYKALIIFQAVTLSYILIAFIIYFLHSIFSLSRAVWLLGWFFTLISCILARVWSTIWKSVVKLEEVKFSILKNENPIKNILLIGGGGYIGSVLTRLLIRRNYKVRVLDMLYYGEKSIERLFSNQNFQLVKGDCRHIETVIDCMKNIDVVIHLAAIVGDRACTINEEIASEINYIATKVIAEVAAGIGVKRLIFTSTCSVYGASDEILDEHSSISPLSLYAKSKLNAEKMLLNMDKNKFSPIILRLATVYGFSYRPRFDLIINLLTAQAMFDRQITIFGGKQWRPFIHVEDVGRAIIKVMEAPLYKVRRQIFNVGSNDQNYQLFRISEIIKNLMPDISVLTKEDNSDHRNYRVSFDRIKRYLDFSPEKNIESGINEIRRAIIAEKITNYTDNIYSNYGFLNSIKDKIEASGYYKKLWNMIE